ncbi:MAG TPA: hypothetical protein VN960_00415 [Gaiellaceae bacterium]|nr:hypothetical protein [Gaiellaceae bacterium]
MALAAIMVGAVFRLVWVLVLHPPFDYLYSDMGGYVGRAMHLVETGSLERYDAFYPPGVHLLLAGIFKAFGPDLGGRGPLGAAVGGRAVLHVAAGASF